MWALYKNILQMCGRLPAIKTGKVNKTFICPEEKQRLHMPRRSIR